MKTSYLSFFVSILFFSFFITNSTISQVQNCLDFTSDYDRMFFPTPISGTDDFTLEAWFKSDNDTGPLLARLFTWWGNGTRFEVGDRDGKLQIFVYNNSSGSDWINTNVNIIDGNWHFVSITRENNNFKVYVDGILENTHSIELLMNNNISVGHWNGTLVSESQWIGRVDEIRLWDIVRTESEIQSTMNSELTGNEPGLVVYLNLNQGIAGGDNTGLITAIDQTGNGFDGNLLDFALNGNTSNWVCSNAMGNIDCPTSPLANFSTNNSEGCAPYTVQFFDESPGQIDSWNWSFPGGSPSSSTEQNPQITYNTPGIYDVTLEVTNTLGSNSFTFEDYIVVNPLTFANFDYSINNGEVIFNNTTQNATSFQWNFGDTSTSTESDPSHEYAQSGSYTVQLIAINDCGADTFTQQIIIDILDLPIAAFSLNNGTGCAPLLVQFADESAGIVESWNWSFPGGTPNTSTDQNPQVIYETPGIFDVSLEVTNATGNNIVTYDAFISVQLPIFASFDYTVNENEVTFINTSQNGTEFQWNFGDNSPESNEENPVYNYNQPGVYLVTFIASNPYCGGAITQAVDVLYTGIKSPDGAKYITIYPNPVQDLLHFQSIINIDHIKISNILGQQVLEIKDAKNNYEIDLKHLPSGNYIFTFLSGDYLWSTEFVKL